MSTTKNSPKPLVLNFRKRNSACGVTRETWKEVADKMGLTETQTLHIAMSRLAQEMGLIERGDGSLPLPSAAEITELEQCLLADKPRGLTLERRSLMGENWESITEAPDEAGLDPERR